MTLTMNAFWNFKTVMLMELKMAQNFRSGVFYYVSERQYGIKVFVFVICYYSVDILHATQIIVISYE